VAADRPEQLARELLPVLVDQLREIGEALGGERPE
jgi:hypothetical protein